MLNNDRSFFIGLLAAICLWVLGFAPVAESQNFQKAPIVLLASEVLPSRC